MKIGPKRCSQIDVALLYHFNNIRKQSCSSIASIRNSVQWEYLCEKTNIYLANNLHMLFDFVCWHQRARFEVFFFFWFIVVTSIRILLFKQKKFVATKTNFPLLTASLQIYRISTEQHNCFYTTTYRLLQNNVTVVSNKPNQCYRAT